MQRREAVSFQDVNDIAGPWCFHAIQHPTTRCTTLTLACDDDAIAPKINGFSKVTCGLFMSGDCCIRVVAVGVGRNKLEDVGAQTSVIGTEVPPAILPS